MRILLVPDGFKDSLPAAKVIEAMQQGIHQLNSSIQTHAIVASDGGDGFLESVQNYLDLQMIAVPTQDPLGRSIQAMYGYDPTKGIAYIELAKASGIELLTAEERNVMKTSTFGTGLQVKDAIQRGAQKIYVGLGGSATNDAATGIVSALGYRFLDAEGKEVIPNGNGLRNIASIRKPDVLDDSIEVIAINDVLNPLYGPQGAAFTYGKQKGASAEELVLLDDGLKNLSEVVLKELGKDFALIPGSGAAGGSAYGLKAFLNAQFINGTSFILGLSDFNELLATHTFDCILTGEGKIDHQTAFGKMVYGVVLEAQNHAIPVFGICGKLDLSPSEVKALGLADAAQLYDPSKPVSYSYEHAYELVAQRTFELLHKHFGTIQSQ